MNFFKKISTDPHITELKGKSHRLSHANGLMELSFTLSPSQREEFERRSKQLAADKRVAISAATMTMETTIAQAKRAAQLATNVAIDAYERAVFALFTEFGKLPSAEQIATSETPIGQVVRLPAGDSGSSGVSIGEPINVTVAAQGAAS